MTITVNGPDPRQTHRTAFALFLLARFSVFAATFSFASVGAIIPPSPSPYQFDCYLVRRQLAQTVAINGLFDKEPTVLHNLPNINAPITEQT